VSRGKADIPRIPAVRLLQAFVDKDFLFKLILALLAWSLVPLGEIFLFIFIGSLIGNSLVLILAAAAGAAGACVGITQARRAASHLRGVISRASYPGQDIVDLTGIVLSAALLITPGFVTDVVGFALLIPAVRTRVGKVIVSGLRTHVRDVYDRLKLSSL
jgi:UPF0716 protein FxsA